MEFFFSINSWEELKKQLTEKSMSQTLKQNRLFWIEYDEMEIKLLRRYKAIRVCQQ